MQAIQPAVRQRYEPSFTRNEEDLRNRIAVLEAQIQSLFAIVPQDVLQDIRRVKDRLSIIEQDEDPNPPIVPPYVGFSGYVYLSAKLFDLTSSTPLKWIVVDWANGTVSYSNTDPSDPFPPGTEYYRTDRVHGDLHVTRIG